MTVVLGVLASALALLFLASGGVKLLRHPRSRRIRDRFGLSPAAWTAIGAAECVGAVGLLAGLVVPLIGLVAAIGLTGLMTGALISRLRVHDPAAMLLLDVAVLALVWVVLALYASD
ncbi:DoxX family protein [Streptomyces sp. NBC_01803]|uniref:DoxX family protein n=1 Tax=Streptomyces sp. NBC_01803 TaxID=2975946 RepID=UPI002DDB0836|nr:DoxX family protein [Streptomyces sp. NBC_01803]WSA46340.1 DoxX family protein [Streptomyces sp. NBC_01803]